MEFIMGRGISTSINVNIIDSDSIVYGRYNELVNGCEWVCKPTNTTGGYRPVPKIFGFETAHGP